MNSYQVRVFLVSFFIVAFVGTVCISFYFDSLLLKPEIPIVTDEIVSIERESVLEKEPLDLEKEKRKAYRKELCDKVSVDPNYLLDVPKEHRKYVAFDYLYSLNLYGHSPGERYKGHWISQAEKMDHARNKINQFEDIAKEAGVADYIFKAASYDSYGAGGRDRTTVGGKKYTTETFKDRYWDWLDGDQAPRY